MATETQVREKIVGIIRRWVGHRESDGSFRHIIDTYNSLVPLPRGYKLTYKDAWCAATITAAAIEAGYTDIIPRECSCAAMIAAFKRMGRWQESDAYRPAPGDCIFYDWQDSGKGDNTGAPDHVGMVERVSGEVITVIEGNYSDSVKRRTIPVNGRYVRGYGLPDYASMTTPETPATAPEKTTAEVAQEVLNGQWGNGPERRETLKAAGYDPDAIQAEVNAIVSGQAAPAKKTPEEIAGEVLLGLWGNGKNRTERLKAAGYDPATIQAKVNAFFAA